MSYDSESIHHYHSPIVVYERRFRDLFRKYYFVRCFTCNAKSGPWPNRYFANVVYKIWSTGPYDHIYNIGLTTPRLAGIV
jgi:hypothetical protein